MTDVTSRDVGRGGRRAMQRGALALALLSGACGDAALDDIDPRVTGEAPLAQTLSKLLSGEGGELVGPAGTPFAGLRLSIPRGALKAPTMISVREAAPTTPLPASAVQVGRSFTLEPTGLTLSTPASLTLPFDPKAVADRARLPRDVRMWVLDGALFRQLLQQESSSGGVTVKLDAPFGSAAPGLVAD